VISQVTFEGEATRAGGADGGQTGGLTGGEFGLKQVDERLLRDERLANRESTGAQLGREGLQRASRLLKNGG
jgi:hypothetical protein